MQTKKQYQNKKKQIKIKRKFTKKHQNGGAASAFVDQSMSNEKQRQSLLQRIKLYKDALQYVKNNKLIGIAKLIEKIYNGKEKNFDMDVSLQDPFFFIPKLIPNFTPEYYMKFYLKRNPDFKEMRDLPTFDTKDLKVDGFDTTKIEKVYNGGSIYETLLAQICRDLLIILLTNKHNVDNNVRQILTLENIKAKIQKYEKQIEKLEYEKKSYNNPLANFQFEQAKRKLDKLREYSKYLNSPTNNNKNNNKKMKKQLEFLNPDIDSTESNYIVQLLKNINECTNNYFYKDILNIILDFIELMSDDNVYFERLNLSLASPLIIFPTYTQINFENVLILCGLPIINFRLTNRVRKVHDFYLSAKGDFLHDVYGHGALTHNVEYPVIKKIINMNKIITVLYPYFNYSILEDGQIKTQKTIMAMILFAIFHPTMKSQEFYQTFFKNILNEMNEMNDDKNKEQSIKFTDELIEIIKHISKVDNFSRVYPAFDSLDLEAIVNELFGICKKEKKYLVEPISEISKINERFTEF